MTDLQVFFSLIHHSYIGTLIRENDVLFPWIESFHIMSVAVVFGSIALVDFRLSGLILHEMNFPQVADKYLKYTWTAFVLAFITGSLLFTSNASGYSANIYFIFKMFLIILAGINMLIFHAFVGKTHSQWIKDQDIPISGKRIGLISLAIWILIIFCGRWIGFTIEPVLAN
jgi:branched-subunit amino acid transport protein